MEDAMSRLVRIYADRDGESHVEELELSVVNPPTPGAAGGTIPSEGRPTLRAYPVRSPEDDWAVVDWHRAPRKTFVVAISGNIEVEVSDGQRLAIDKGDLVYLEDTTGKGHVTRLRGAVTNLFIPVQPDFDVLAWVERHGAPDPAPG
jgi:hypothetical protein